MVQKNRIFRFLYQNQKVLELPYYQRSSFHIDTGQSRSASSDHSWSCWIPPCWAGFHAWQTPLCHHPRQHKVSPSPTRASQDLPATRKLYWTWQSLCPSPKTLCFCFFWLCWSEACFFCFQCISRGEIRCDLIRTDGGYIYGSLIVWIIQIISQFHNDCFF